MQEREVDIAIIGAGSAGVRVGTVEVDGRAVMERVQRERDGFVGSVLKTVERLGEENRLEGHARFDDPHTLMVGDHTRVSARNIIIATGSRGTWPGFFEAAGDRLVVNDAVFEWDDLPESVAVFGPGVLGLELGQALHRLGVRLRVFGVGGALGPFQDEAVRDYADRTFNEEFYVDPDAKVERIERDGDDVVFTDPQIATIGTSRAELFGPRVEHMAHLLAWMLEQKLSVSRILEMPFYHPVLEEGLRSALHDLNASLRQGPA
ncbi:FAD-dependent oxidoreductase, partial [Halomonas sp.]|uniref:FAD-dependent oxidoreductase n=1 Tax=Halomonas sp. TaxID=1486246 RepID=UPI003566C6FA